MKKVSVHHIHCILCDAWFIINKKLHKGNLQTQADVVHHLHTQAFAKQQAKAIIQYYTNIIQSPMYFPKQ